MPKYDTSSSTSGLLAACTVEAFRRASLPAARASAAFLAAQWRELLRERQACAADAGDMAATAHPTVLWLCVEREALPCFVPEFSDRTVGQQARELGRMLARELAREAASGLCAVPRVIAARFSPALLEAAARELAARRCAVVAMLVCRRAFAAAGAPTAQADAAAELICEFLRLRPAPDQPDQAACVPAACAGRESAALPCAVDASRYEEDGQDREELVADGVRYAQLRQAGLEWRLASVNPLWRQELLALPATPAQEAVRGLEDRGIWLAPAAAAPPLAVMCSGMGAVWPGMGRELYDNFPAARAAMDRIAAVADWDVLALMDETDLEKISLSRWQSPYVFLLEYAQWSQFVSLGLKPALMSGHSLGELIALCFAGVYEPEVAWYILDTRAVHVGELEAKATRETGMMAVHADAGIIDAIRASWPALYVSNYNTPSQFILSGPREALLEARKSLRKRRIPAIMLNVSLAFHHPSMRVLRDLSLRRLNALEMHAPRLPLLSNITTGFYPDDQPSICRYIADLDENSVRWTECVRAMWDRHGIRHFLELGPQDTLCGLVNDIEPRGLCLSAGRKGRETEGLRQSCARLYALGHLPRAALRAHLREPRPWEASAGGHAAPAAPYGGLRPLGEDPPDPPETPCRGEATPAEGAAPAAPVASPDTSAAPPPQLRIVLEVLAQASGRPAEELRPEMDLRYDLALRSSRFPLIIQEVEQRLGLTINFEDLLQVATVGDLARILGAAERSPAQGKKPLDAAGPAPRPVRARASSPLCRFAPVPSGEGAPQGGCPEAERDFCASLRPLALDPCGQGLPLRRGDVLALFVFHPTLLPGLLSGIAPLGCTLAVPQGLLDACAPLARAGARLAPLSCGVESRPDAESLRAIVQALAGQEGRVDGVLFVPHNTDAPQSAALLLEDCLRAATEHGLRYACVLSVQAPERAAFACDGPLEQRLASLALEGGFAARAIRLLDGGLPAGLNEFGDMLAREMLRGSAERVIWARESDFCPDRSPRAQLMLERPEFSPLVFPDPQPRFRPTATLFQGACHFSRFADPALAAHGGRGEKTGGGSLPRLPVSRALQSLVEGSRLLLPWLAVTGLSDVRFHELPLLPPGVTRECRLTVEAIPWLAQDQVMTRMCRANLSVRRLTANGRHTGQYAAVSSGMVLLAATPGEVPPLWPASKTDCSGQGVERINNVYDALGMGEPWRILSGFSALPGGICLATLSAPEQPIAPESNWSYTKVLQMVEGLVQAASLVIALEGSAATPAEALRRWRLNAAGFIRFGAERGGQGPCRLRLRRSWADGKLLRFDAQAEDARGRVLVTLHHLEFDRQEEATPKGADEQQ